MVVVDDGGGVAWWWTTPIGRGNATTRRFSKNDRLGEWVSMGKGKGKWGNGMGGGGLVGGVSSFYRTGYRRAFLEVQDIY